MDRVGGARCCWGVRPTIPGREDDETLDSMVHPVSVDELATLWIELVAGRSWAEPEAKADPMPMVPDASLAREMAGTPEAALGLPVKFQFPPLSGIVVGVAADTRHYSLDQEIGNQLYLPVHDHGPFTGSHAPTSIRSSSVVFAPTSVFHRGWWSADQLGGRKDIRTILLCYMGEDMDAMREALAGRRAYGGDYQGKGRGGGGRQTAWTVRVDSITDAQRPARSRLTKRGAAF